MAGNFFYFIHPVAQEHFFQMEEKKKCVNYSLRTKGEN